LEESSLECVVGRGAVAEDGSAGAEDERAVAADEFGERGLVPALGVPPEELPVGGRAVGGREAADECERRTDHGHLGWGDLPMV
jgi:hypothetical protein